MTGRPPVHDWDTLMPLVRARLDAGERIYQVAQSIGVPYSTLKARCREAGIGERRPRKLTYADREAIRRSAAAGTPHRVLAERYGVSQGYVQRLATRGDTACSRPGFADGGRSHRASIIVKPGKLDQPRHDLRLARPDRIREAIDTWRERGLSDPAIARQLRLTASVAAGYGLAVREDVADPFGMDPRRRRAA